jgi:hypothetical protein
VFRPYVLTASQIRDGAGDLADFIMGTGRQTEFHHRLFEKRLRGDIQLAELFNLLMGISIRSISGPEIFDRYRSTWPGVHLHRRKSLPK